MPGQKVTYLLIVLMAPPPREMQLIHAIARFISGGKYFMAVERVDVTVLLFNSTTDLCKLAETLTTLLRNADQYLLIRAGHDFGSLGMNEIGAWLLRYWRGDA